MKILRIDSYIDFQFSCFIRNDENHTDWHL